MVKSCAIIIGHTANSQGARTYSGVSEYVLNTKIAGLMLDYAFRYKDLECSIFRRDNIGMTGVAKMTYLRYPQGVDCSIELHFNSFHRKAYGCEVLIADHINEQDFGACYYYADVITDMLNEHPHYGFRERHEDGVKVIKKGDRGFHNLKVMHKIAKTPIALLIEPQFLNHKTPQAKAIVEHPEKYAHFLAECLFTECMGLDKV